MSSAWPVAELGRHLRVKHGCAFRGEHFGDSGDFIVLTPGNFYDEGGFKRKDGAEKFYTAEPPPEYVLKRDDLVVAMTEQVRGLLGSSALIPCDDVYLHNQRIGLVELQPDVDRRFVYYLFNTHLVREQIQATATGSKVRHTAPSRIEAVKVPLPPLATQRRIGAILSAHDDLIENNRRRIKLLEEIAQRIYREWFVAYRFPGHQDVPRVASALGSIPEGWNVATLGDVLTLEYGRALKEADRRGGPVLVIGSSGPVGSHDEALARGPGIVVGRKGNAGAVHWVDTDFFPIDTVFYVASEWPKLFLLYALRDHRWVTTDTAVPGVSRQKAYLDPMLVPSISLAEQFSAMVSPIRSLIRALDAQRRNLAAARDMLLPRLISGAITVDDLEIAVDETTA